MKSSLRRTDALPLHGLSQHPDVVLALGVGAVVAMLVLPLPAVLLDMLLAFDMAMAALVLVGALFAQRALKLSTFPSLLLLSTLFRLALNVSTTRMILSEGSAGDVVEAFGTFVVRGDVVVGVVIFAIVTLVQFLVIAKGSERVAEVGARFTLDAMPGKQMSIDADLRNGGITEEQAKVQRAELGRESKFFGAMDGAMKFVKGDAIAGLIITALNLVVGLSLGVLRYDLDVLEAAETYCLLTIGDGLVSQIPALLIALAAGILCTRVADEDSESLGHDLLGELASQPKVLALGAIFSLVLGLVPGLPFFPFFVISGVFFAMCFYRARPKPKTQAQDLEARLQRARAQRSLVDNLAPSVMPCTLLLDPVLFEALRLSESQEDLLSPLFSSVLPAVRRELYQLTGVRFPAVGVRRSAGLDEASFTVLVKDVPVFSGQLRPRYALALESPEGLARLGLRVEAAQVPAVFGSRTASWVEPEDADLLADAQIKVHNLEEQLGLHLMFVLRQHATDFLGLHETSQMVDRLATVFPKLTQEVVPKLVTLGRLAEILRRLVDEGVCIRDMKTVLECLAEHATYEQDGVVLTELVRSALSLQLAHQHVGSSERLNAVTLDALVEDTIRGAIQRTAQGSYLALDPVLRRHILRGLAKVLRGPLAAGVQPVLLCQADIRRYVRVMVREELTEVAVLSYQELPGRLTIHPLGRVTLDTELPAAA